MNIDSQEALEFVTAEAPNGMHPPVQVEPRDLAANAAAIEQVLTFCEQGRPTNNS